MKKKLMYVVAVLSICLISLSATAQPPVKTGSTRLEANPMKIDQMEANTRGGSISNIPDCFCCGEGIYSLPQQVPIKGSDEICKEGRYNFEIAKCQGATITWSVQPATVAFSGQQTNQIGINYSTIPFGTNAITVAVEVRCGKMVVIGRKQVKVCLKKMEISQGQDALLHGLPSQQNTNFGSSLSNPVIAWTYYNNPANVFSVIKFNLPSPIPTGITSATLSLRELIAPGNGTHAGAYGPAVKKPTQFVIRALTTPWNENTVTWANYNPFTNSTTNAQVVVPAYVGGNAPDNITVNVTSVVNQMIANGNHGLIIMWNVGPTDAVSYFRSRHFGSFNSNLPPVLTIQ